MPPREAQSLSTGSIRFVMPAVRPFTRVRGRLAAVFSIWVISSSFLVQVQIPRLPLLFIGLTRVQTSVYSGDMSISSATKPKPRWDVHLPEVGGRAGSLAGGIRPLIAGPCGSGA